MPNARRIVAAASARSLGAEPMATAARLVSSRRLRIPAFHGIDDRQRFIAQLAVLRAYTPITGDDISAAIMGVHRLPRNPVWLTFDDGHPEVVRYSALLREHGHTACLFVCPGVIDTQTPLWWQVREQAVALGLVGAAEAQRFSLTRLKRLPDDSRRAEIELLGYRLQERNGVPPTQRQITSAELAHWVADGHEIGNHTWDHPCLSQCDADSARGQVVRADEWLVGRGIRPRFLAYPNGDSAPAAEEAAAELGYAGSFLFDHRLTDIRARRHALSRLRLDADASPSRARAVLSGAHSGLFHAFPR